MSCKNVQIRELLPEYASGKITPEEADRVRAHLKGCARCRDELQIIGFFSEVPVPEPAPGFWNALPARVTAICVRKPRKGFRLPIPSQAWGLAVAAALVAVILSAWPSAPPKVEDGMLAEYFLEETGSPGLGIEEEILSVSGLLVAEVNLSLDGEIDLSGELEDIDVMGGSFSTDLYEGMDLTMIRILEKLIEDVTPKGAERG